MALQECTQDVVDKGHTFRKLAHANKATDALADRAAARVPVPERAVKHNAELNKRRQPWCSRPRQRRPWPMPWQHVAKFTKARHKQEGQAPPPMVAAIRATPHELQQR